MNVFVAADQNNLSGRRGIQNDSLWHLLFFHYLFLFYKHTYFGPDSYSPGNSQIFFKITNMVLVLRNFFTIDCVSFFFTEPCGTSCACCYLCYVFHYTVAVFRFVSKKYRYNSLSVSTLNQCRIIMYIFFPGISSSQSICGFCREIISIY